ncbi:MAG: hypothetical protein IKD76_04580 [Clostridia bacterium]|nr:hypothetical protein [Clostridia bacterium]
MKEKLLVNVDKKGTKRTVENLVVFVIILIATVIFINYIWNGNKKDAKEENNSVILTDTENVIVQDVATESNTLEKQIEEILKKLDGVGDAKVLITYTETSRVVPMYNEDSQQSVTKEEDVQGRS